MTATGRVRKLDRGRAAVRLRRTAAARRQAETFLERPIFGIKRPFSNARGTCGPRAGQISTETRPDAWSRERRQCAVRETQRMPGTAKCQRRRSRTGGDQHVSGLNGLSADLNCIPPGEASHAVECIDAVFHVSPFCDWRARDR